MPVADREGYLRAARERWVEPDRDRRRETILEALRARAETLGLELRLEPKLVEGSRTSWSGPWSSTGSFDEDLIQLPPRLLVESMRVHQRTFPTWREGSLTRHFLVVTNSPKGDPEVIAGGNSRVLAARFHDALFFTAEDRKLSLREHAEGLAGMQWVRGLGSMEARQDRVWRLAGRLAQAPGALGR